MKISYNWLQNYFKEKLPAPEKLAEGIIFHSFEVEGMEKTGSDTVFEIKILPDRAHDSLSHWGIAKEISAIFNLKIFQTSSKKQTGGEIKNTNLKIEIKDGRCRRYIGRVVRNIKIGPSPAWLREKLETIGQRPINNIVDAANFAMFDLGQPIHCFDLDKLKSEKLLIRAGEKGEKLITLDKKEVRVDESVLVIADEEDPLVIAGIKGGIKAEVDDKTRNIVIEVANFDPVSVRKTSRKIGILTDAVKRYENEITPELCGRAMEEVTDLILKIAGGEEEKAVDVYLQKSEQKTILVSTRYINKYLGTDFSLEEIKNVWQRLGFEYEEENGEFKIMVPFERLDISGLHDLSEEVGRISGYEKIKAQMPETRFVSGMNDTFKKMLYAREKLLSEGYSEVMTYSFRGKGEIEVLASASDKKFLRTNLSDGLKESLKLNQLNLPLLGMNEVNIFEIGTVFNKTGEKMHVAYNKKKEIKEMTLDEFSKDMPAGFSLPFRSIENAKFNMWSLFPFISRDVAVWVPNEVESSQVYKILKENGGELLVRDPYLFDEFKKDSKTSYAFRLVFQSYERTLKNEEIDRIMTIITNKIKEKIGWQIR